MNTVELFAKQLILFCVFSSKSCRKVFLLALFSLGTVKYMDAHDYIIVQFMPWTHAWAHFNKKFSQFRILIKCLAPTRLNFNKRHYTICYQNINRSIWYMIEIQTHTHSHIFDFRMRCCVWEYRQTVNT